MASIALYAMSTKLMSTVHHTLGLFQNIKADWTVQHLLDLSEGLEVYLLITVFISAFQETRPANHLIEIQV